MGLAAERHLMTLDEFRARESTQAERWAFFGGEADRAHRQLKEDPLLIAEVLSPSTEACDRGDTFAAHRRFPGLATIPFLSQDRPDVECYTRADAGRWTLSEARGGDATLTLPALGIELTLAELYRDLPDASPTPKATAPAA